MHSGEAIPRVSAQTRMPDVIYEMSRKKLGMTAVVDGDRLLGVISDGDLRRLLEQRGKDTLDLTAQDAGDGPAVFVILFLGAIVVGLAALVEINFAPPIWVHLLLWPPVIVVGAVALLRPLKAGLIALQYRHRLLGTPPQS